ncbi:MAG: hypothetical protein H3C34_14305 [Caldilineaceae bacterium]|nr:hypothetical protein [Caldilineaceae bacterium]
MTTAQTGASQTGTWWMRRWQTFLQQIGVSVAGETAAPRGCRIKRLEVSPGLIQAQVVDREHGPATVEIRFPTLADAQWDAVIEALAGQAIFAAQLLAGNMPPEIEAIFAQAGTALLPAEADNLEHSCSGCPPKESLCRPLVTVYWQLGDMLADDPWLLLRLRGRDRQQLLAALHEQRNAGDSDAIARVVPAVDGAGAMQNNAFYTPPQSGPRPEVQAVPSLEECVGDFWGRRKVLEEVHHHLAKPAVELALLRRLGPPAQNSDGMEAYAQLQKIYRRVTEMAWDVAFAPDDESPNGLNGNGDDGGHNAA